MLSLDRLDLAGLIAGLCLLPAIAVDAGLAEICLCCGGCLDAAVFFCTIEPLEGVGLFARGPPFSGFGDAGLFACLYLSGFLSFCLPGPSGF